MWEISKKKTDFFHSYINACYQYKPPFSSFPISPFSISTFFSSQKRRESFEGLCKSSDLLPSWFMRLSLFLLLICVDLFLFFVIRSCLIRSVFARLGTGSLLFFRLCLIFLILLLIDWWNKILKNWSRLLRNKMIYVLQRKSRTNRSVCLVFASRICGFILKSIFKVLECLGLILIYSRSDDGCVWVISLDLLDCVFCFILLYFFLIMLIDSEFWLVSLFIMQLEGETHSWVSVFRSCCPYSFMYHICI